MSTQKSGVLTTPPFDWGMLAVLTIGYVFLGVLALVIGKNTGTWHYPIMAALALFVVGYFVSLEYVPRGSTWEPFVAIGGWLFSFVLLLGLIHVSFVWWLPALVALVVLGVGALLRRI